MASWVTARARLFAQCVAPLCLICDGCMCVAEDEHVRMAQVPGEVLIPEPIRAVALGEAHSLAVAGKWQREPVPGAACA